MRALPDQGQQEGCSLFFCSLSPHTSPLTPVSISRLSTAVCRPAMSDALPSADLLPDQARLDRVRVVMVNTSHPGNIGSAARAMKTMGLSDLVLVAPDEYPSAVATALASGAGDILHRARVVSSLQAAVADCALVLAASARSRTIPWPVLGAREAGALVAQASTGAQVALVFGREERGLTNEELMQASVHVQIPSDAGYGVLNVAQAVQVLAYEVRMANLLAVQQPDSAPEMQRLNLDLSVQWDERPATMDEMEHFYAHLQQTAVALGYLDPDNPRRMMPRMRRLFGRARPDRLEVAMLRGLLKEAGLRAGGHANSESDQD